MDKPHTTPEQRAALRARYTPEPVPRCPHCGGKRAVSWEFAPRLQMQLFRCATPECTKRRPDTDTLASTGDADVLAALADADALAGALAERDDAMEAQENAWRNVNLLTERLGAERTALHEEVFMLRAAMDKARDILDGVERRMIDAGQAAEDDEDEDWWGDTVEEVRGAIDALAPDPAPQHPQKRALTGLYAPQAPASSNAGAAGESGATRGTVKGIEG